MSYADRYLRERMVADSKMERAALYSTLAVERQEALEAAAGLPHATPSVRASPAHSSIETADGWLSDGTVSSPENRRVAGYRGQGTVDPMECDLGGRDHGLEAELSLGRLRSSTRPVRATAGKRTRFPGLHMADDSSEGPYEVAPAPAPASGRRTGQRGGGKVHPKSEAKNRRAVDNIMTTRKRFEQANILRHLRKFLPGRPPRRATHAQTLMSTAAAITTWREEIAQLEAREQHLAWENENLIARTYRCLARNEELLAHLTEASDLDMAGPPELAAAAFNWGDVTQLPGMVQALPIPPLDDGLGGGSHFM